MESNQFSLADLARIYETAQAEVAKKRRTLRTKELSLMEAAMIEAELKAWDDIRAKAENQFINHPGRNNEIRNAG